MPQQRLQAEQGGIAVGALTVQNTCINMSVPPKSFQFQGGTIASGTYYYYCQNKIWLSLSTKKRFLPECGLACRPCSSMRATFMIDRLCTESNSIRCDTVRASADPERVPHAAWWTTIIPQRLPKLVSILPICSSSTDNKRPQSKPTVLTVDSRSSTLRRTLGCSYS